MDMDAGTNDYLRLVADSSWLHDEQGGGRSPVDPYIGAARSQRKQVHKQPWRFNPSKSKTFNEIGSQKNVERSLAERLLLTELQQRHQDQLEGRDPNKPRRRRRGPRTLQPMPRMPKGHHASKARNNNASSSPYMMRSNLLNYNDAAINDMNQYSPTSNAMGGNGGQRGGMGNVRGMGGGMAGQGGGGGMNNMNNMNNMNMNMMNMNMRGGMGGNSPPGVFNDQNDYYRWKEEQGTVVSAVSKQLSRYKTECKRLRKQKRATLYVLRLLEQKILELSGSNATAERIDPQAPGYEMHPEVYKILKEGRNMTKGCRGVQTGSDEVDVVEDYALERSAHELGLKLVRDTATKKADQEENEEVKEIRQRRKEAEEEAKLAAETAAAEEIAQAEEDAKQKKSNSNSSTDTSDGTAENISVEENTTGTTENEENVLPEENISLQDKMRHEHLESRKKKFRGIFDRLDADVSGYLDKKELRKAVFFGDGELGSYINPSKFSQAFAAMDYNSNGEIPYEAFEHFMLDCEDAASANLPQESNESLSKKNATDTTPQMLGESRQDWTDEKLKVIFERLDTSRFKSVPRP